MFYYWNISALHSSLGGAGKKKLKNGHALPNQSRARLTGSLQSDGEGEEFGSIAVKPSFIFAVNKIP